MARTNAAELDEIWTNDLDKEAKDAFIEMANVVVTRELGGEGISASTLTDIEKLVAIHFCKTEQPDEQTVGDTSLVHPPNLNGLRETQQGRRAVLMDPTGNLALAAKPTAKLRSFGPTHDSA